MQKELKIISFYVVKLEDNSTKNKYLGCRRNQPVGTTDNTK